MCCGSTGERAGSGEVTGSRQREARLQTQSSKEGRGMRITGLRTYRSYVNWRNWLFVRLYTDEGITGIGEATLHGNARAVEASIHEMESYLMGQDPFGIERHWEAIYHGRRWRGGPVLNSALSGVESALWDIIGKTLGVPVYKLLGGPYRDRIKVYANGWFGGVEDEGVGAGRTKRDSGEPDATWAAERLAQMAKKVVESGYEALKLNPFGPKSDERRMINRGVQVVGAIRDAVGSDIDILIECSERFTPRGAIMAAEALAPLRPGFLEEPVRFENAQAMARVTARSDVPIATGERLYNRYDFRDLLQLQAVDIIQPDLTHVGGILECKKLAAMAEVWYASVAPHNSGGPISHAMAIQMAACTPNFLILESFVDEDDIRQRSTTVPFPVADGYLDVPESPGLGTDLIEEVLDEYPSSEASWSSDGWWPA
jgi:galactonate dehydratase